MRYFNIIFKTGITLVIVFFTITLWAQPKIISPYSKLGIGDLRDDRFYTSANMGGLSAAFQSSNHINLMNPACLGTLRTATFEAGIHGQRGNLATSLEEQEYWSGNIDYFSLAFPIFNPINRLLDRKSTDFNYSMSISLTPFSEVGYDIVNEEEVDGIGLVDRKYSGSGNINKLSWGHGFNYKHFGAGFSIGYVFGELNYRKVVNFPELGVYYINVEDQFDRYKGFTWNAGLSYDFILSQEIKSDGSKGKIERKLVVGIYGRSKQKVNTFSDGIFYRTINLASLVDLDTLEHFEDLEGEIKLASVVGAGLMYSTKKSQIGLDYEMGGWSKYESSVKTETLTDTWRVMIGGNYSPDKNSLTNLWKRSTYYAGAYTGKDYRDSGYWGVNFGIELPFIFQRQFSSVSIGLETGQTGLNSDIKDFILLGRIGFTLNDNQWFLKRKYD
jgi:hypothetical protein